MTNDEIRDLLKKVRRMYREERRKCNMTQTAFAEMLDADRTTINFILRFSDYRPGRKALDRLSRGVRKVERQQSQSVET